MNAVKSILVVLSIFLTACGSAPVKRVDSGATATAPAKVSSASTCPSAFDKDAIMKYGYPEAWNREFREPPTVYPLFKCEWMQPMIEWAKSASTYETDRGGCTGSHTSFTCTSSRGPSGTSRRGSERSAQGTRLELLIAEKTLRPCTDAASERRELSVSVAEDGWEFRARQECYY